VPVVVTSAEVIGSLSLRVGACVGAILQHLFRLINPASRLRFPPLQVLAQGFSQPGLPGQRGVVRRAIWCVGHGVLCWLRCKSLEEGMRTETYALAPPPQQNLKAWRWFVVTRDGAMLPPLLAEDVVFRSPAVQSPIPGRDAGVRVAHHGGDDFREFPLLGYHRTSRPCRRWPRNSGTGSARN
jgi:hypothetical protein